MRFRCNNYNNRKNDFVLFKKCSLDRFLMTYFCCCRFKAQFHCVLLNVRSWISFNKECVKTQATKVKINEQKMINVDQFNEILKLICIWHHAIHSWHCATFVYALFPHWTKRWKNETARRRWKQAFKWCRNTIHCLKDAVMEMAKSVWKQRHWGKSSHSHTKFNSRKIKINSVFFARYKPVPSLHICMKCMQSVVCFFKKAKSIRINNAREMCFFFFASRKLNMRKKTLEKEAHS